jgi:oxygen-dependent protoporphyrinogen oxidase
MPGAKVAVIGGGLAGLAAASRLAALGAEVALFEREERPGGRAASEREKDFAFEPGAHAVASSDLRLLDLVARTGLAERLLPLRPLALAQVERGRAYRIHPQSPRGVGRIPGLGRLARLRLARLPRLLGRHAPLLDPEAPERAAPRDDRSAADFVRLYFGSRVLERWIGPWLSDTALCEPEAASRVLALGLLAFRRHAWLGTLRGDLGDVAAALAGSLRARCGVAVRAIEPRAAGFRVHHAGPAGQGESDADAVVLAVPPPDVLAVAADVLASAERDVLRARRAAPALGLTLGLESPLAAHATRIRVPRREGLPFATLVLEPGVPGARVPEGRGLAVLLGAADARALDAADERVASRWIAALDGLLPGAAARVAWTRVHRWVSAFPRFDVGDHRALARLRRVEADARARGRRLYLAGDHLIGPTLEAAVVSGERAAAALAEDLGIPARST